MKYVLENAAEGSRLEKQATFNAYNLDAELNHFRLPTNLDQPVLDAGCGTGLVARALSQMHPNLKLEGGDASDIRLHEARGLSSRQIQYFRTDLDGISRADNYFGGVVCRYVFEHLNQPAHVAQEFFRVLAPGGRVMIINFDGILFNLNCANAELNSLLEELRHKWTQDLFAGRSVPQWLNRAGFKNIEWHVEAHGFQGAQLLGEIELTRTRLTFAFEVLRTHLGSNDRARRFVDLYLEVMAQPGSSLFYNKFIVHGQK